MIPGSLTGRATAKSTGSNWVAMHWRFEEGKAV
jgi:hypothetical protein